MQQYKRPLKFIWDSFKGHKKMFYVFFTGKIIEGIFYVIFPVLAKLEMDQLVEKNEQLFGIIKLDNFNIFLVILLIIFGFKLIENFLKSILDFFQYDYIKMYDNYYSQALYKRLETVEPGLFLNSRNKRFVGDIIGNASQIGEWVRRFVGDIISNIFMLIGILTVLALINFWIFIILFVSSVVIYFIEKFRQKYQEKEEFEDRYRYNEKIWILTEQMEKNLSYLMSSGGFSLILKYYHKSSEELRNKVKYFQKRIITLNIFSFFIENLSELFVKIIVAFSIFFSTASVGTMTMALLYVGKINGLFSFFRHFKFDFDRFKDDLLKLDLFLDITKLKKTKNFNLDNFSSIEFKNLNFKYPNSAKQELKYLEIVENRIKSYSKNGDGYKDQLHMVEESRKEAKKVNPIILENISLSFNIGKTYGIVGKNGAGKTTLISLILNYFDNYEGDILIDGKQLKDFKREFFVNNVSVINQVPYIIDGFSIKENLFLGVDKEYEDDYVFSLLRKFGLEKKVLKNRKGLDSRLGYDNDFSGGEKQLIALIRVILQDKKILIMDEGTNQLDADNEILVMKELLKHKKDKIVIFITHRMTTIRKVDMIYCLENGAISASGNHYDLKTGDNVYSNFWRKQVEE